MICGFCSIGLWRIMINLRFMPDRRASWRQCPKKDSQAITGQSRIRWGGYWVSIISSAKDAYFDIPPKTAAAYRLICRLHSMVSLQPLHGNAFHEITSKAADSPTNQDEGLERSIAEIEQVCLILIWNQRFHTKSSWHILSFRYRTCSVEVSGVLEEDWHQPSGLFNEGFFLQAVKQSSTKLQAFLQNNAERGKQTSPAVMANDSVSITRQSAWKNASDAMLTESEIWTARQTMVKLATMVEMSYHPISFSWVLLSTEACRFVEILLQLRYVLVRQILGQILVGSDLSHDISGPHAKHLTHGYQ